MPENIECGSCLAGSVREITLQIFSSRATIVYTCILTCGVFVCVIVKLLLNSTSSILTA